MKKISSKLAILLAIPVLFVGCGNPAKKDSSVKHDKSVKVSKKSTKKNNKKDKSLWNAKKTAQLENYMQTFSKDMNQDYKSYNPSKNVSFYGIKFPEFFAEDKIQVKGDHVSVAWSDKGEKTADYSVVAIYSDIETSSSTFGNHLYLFAIKDGAPVVLITEQNQGMPDGMIHFNPTMNKALSTNFAKIVGNTSNVKSTVSSSKENKQAGIVPKNLIGTWYKLDDEVGIQTVKFESNKVGFNNDGLSEIHEKSEYLPDEDPMENIIPERGQWRLGMLTNVRGEQWLNIRGWYQTAGVGSYFKVFNRKIDGKNVPVLSSAAGSGVWVDSHYYQSKELAQKMGNQSFDGEVTR